ncbi:MULTISPECIES: L-threonylcarbamoyladenylate synthase [unclassified Thioalkalivibrio]|uniref:L-threonylcarbamoyladenylate synthase n=1 Tax=unclassified Thioalkalivibrio TaxID=2621013 RepID=UPI000368B3F5|nr:MULTISPECIES: Sua5/YciO/YrdC/YwlC family protein [unclassified Thioalkalivibrio]
MDPNNAPLLTADIDPVAQTVRDGGVIAYPTEAVFGLGCRPDIPEAIERILEIKGRPAAKGVIVVTDTLERLGEWLAPLPEAHRAAIEASWPGPTTWLLPVTAACPPLLRGEHDSLAVRVTAYPATRALCAAAESALISTSANRAGEEPCRNWDCVASQLGAGIDAILQAECGGRDTPSAIRDARTGAWLRGGPGADATTNH